MLGMIAADPHDAVAAHDRVYRIGLPRERRGVRTGDLGAGEVVEAALASRVTVDHPHRPRPTRLLARLPRPYLRPGRVRGLHVRGSDAPHEHDRPHDLAD